MGTRKFEMVKGATLRIDPLAGDSLRVRSGEAWVTQHKDTSDYMLMSGDSLTLNGKGVTLAVAYEPALLDLFREDPAGSREQIERQARHLRLRNMWAMLRKIFA